LSGEELLRKLGGRIPRPIREQLRSLARSATGTSSLEAAHRTAERRIAELESEIGILRARLADAEASAGQWASILRREATLPPPPPPHLQIRVAGKYAPGFFDSAFEACRDIAAALEPSGTSLREFETILDFGCGSGRAIRILHGQFPDARLFGTDIDAEAVAWLQKHYAAYGEFEVAPHHPPTGYAAGTFDFVFAISVFSHLPEDMQFEWLAELRRITRPNGLLVLTTHGEERYKTLSAEVLETMRTKGFFYGDFGWNYGRSISLPDFYQTAYHSHEYIRREWSRYFDVLEIRALGIEQHQDTVLLRRRASG
jgi:SAM-dependent methyltransferase